MTTPKIYGGSLSYLGFLMHLIQQKHFTNVYNVKAKALCHYSILQEYILKIMYVKRRLLLKR